MSDVIIYGVSASSYVRTARMSAAEKGVRHELTPVEFGADSHRALHPFLKVPAMRHGDVMLYETIAIAYYLDSTFEGGTKLFPTERMAHVRALEYISVATSYLYPACIGNIVLQYIFPKGEGGKPDTATIEAAVPKAEQGLDVIEQALRGQEWLAGPFSAADLFVAAIAVSMMGTPEKRLLETRPNVLGLIDRVGKRPAGEFLVPK
ncbi:MAG: glutathione S-transferase family protein [Nannocystaceae bacterium]|nr:glutathione S-transferase family protein [Nannocystaceae bacterium]